MKEGPPIPIEERVVADRLKQLPTALGYIKCVEEIVEVNGPQGVMLEGPRDGKTEKFPVDQQVLTAMRGGVFGIYNELVLSGHKEEADIIIADFKKGETNGS